MVGRESKGIAVVRLLAKVGSGRERASMASETVVVRLRVKSSKMLQRDDVHIFKIANPSDGRPDYLSTRVGVKYEGAVPYGNQYLIRSSRLDYFD